MKNTQYYSLSDVAKLLKKQPYQITYTIVTKKVPEPQFRIAGKRLFNDIDIERLRSHFEIKNREKEHNEISERKDNLP